jgi:hypothetical protein
MVSLLTIPVNVDEVDWLAMDDQESGGGAR